mgnify:CR=1 FL=1
MSNHKQDTLPRLGRGLEALIPKSFIGAGKTILQLPVKDVFANTYQPRTVFSESSIETLAHSIKKNGLAQPIVVREADSGYELIAGERRWRAAQLAGLKQIPAVVRELSDDAAVAMSLIENIQRVSKPGLRIFKSSKELPTVKNGLGVCIVSTSHGVMSDKEAREKNYGGEIICFVS